MFSFRYSIKNKIATGYVVIFIVFIVNGVIGLVSLNNTLRIEKQITNEHIPLLIKSKELGKQILSSQRLIESWTYSPTAKANSELNGIYKVKYPVLKQEILDLHSISTDKNLVESDKIPRLIKLCDKFYKSQKEIFNKPSAGDRVIKLFEKQLSIEYDLEDIISALKEIESYEEGLISDLQKKKEMSLNRLENILVYIAIFLLIIGTIASVVLTKGIADPIRKLKNVLNLLGRGELPKTELKASNDEIGEMILASNNLIEGLKKTSKFANEIGKGNLDSKFEPLSNNDTLGNSLVEMRKNLIKARNEEQVRKDEEEKQNWSVKGMAKFGEILRLNNDDLDKLSYILTSKLVNYLNANQGGLFIVNDDEKENVVLDLVAVYAYEYKRSREKEIELGEGIIGACALEKETIYITELPQDYVSITSGLGEATPNFLVVVPLLFNEEVYGVIEIASFKEIEDYQIKFLEKICESIASTVSTLRINTKTAKLLAESEQYSREMVKQEEKMKQNIEEMRAAQEGAEENEKELKKKIEELEKKITDFESGE